MCAQRVRGIRWVGWCVCAGSQNKENIAGKIDDRDDIRGEGYRERERREMTDGDELLIGMMMLIHRY